MRRYVGQHKDKTIGDMISLKHKNSHRNKHKTQRRKILKVGTLLMH